MNRGIVRQLVNIVAVIATIVVNGLANGLPLNGLNTGEISDRFQVYFVPAGYVFAIWGVIYLGLIAFAIYQALPSQRDNPRLVRIGTLFALSCAANIAWIFLWHYERFPLTLLAMISLLLLLIAIYLRLGIGRTAAPRAETLMVHLPFSIYLGWITVATIANVTDVLNYWGWNGGVVSLEGWAVIMLVIATALASVVSLTRGDTAYMLVIAWAFAGIGVKQAATPIVATTAWIMTAIVLVMMVVGAWFHHRRTSLWTLW